MIDSSEKRKGYWDQEEDEEAAEKGASGASPDGIFLTQKIQEALALLEQTHQLYLQYFNGVEKRVPIEKIQLLESKASELQRLASHGTSNKFKFTQFQQQYASMKDLWTRKLREKERK